MKWFANMSDKNRATFIKLDIIFYPCFPETSQLIAFFAKKPKKNNNNISMEITDGEIYILTAREPLLALNDSTWIKCRNDNFDVLM